jgi:Skp family chaperone for outer membrane proteins
MKTLTRSLLVSLLLGLASLSVQAQNRFAVINMKAVFDGYWKTKQSDATIKERQGEYEKERRKMQEDFEKLNAEFRELDRSARDPAVSEEEQRKRRDAANSKLLEIREIERSVRDYDANFRTQIADQIQRLRENIFRDIREVVEAKSKAAGYNLVLNTAAEQNQVPVIMFTTGLPDLTQEVLNELNAKAPPGALDAKDTKPEKKP